MKRHFALESATMRRLCEHEGKRETVAWLLARD
jgi:hypothetical protein